MGRLAVVRAMVLGGVTHFSLMGDRSTLFEDIRLVRPTFLSLVPRVSEMIHHAHRQELQRQLQSGLDPAPRPGPGPTRSWAPPSWATGSPPR